MHVLVVEDDARLAEALARILQDNGYATDVVHDGEAGVQYGGTGTYDVIILDVMLPKADGFTVAQRLRRAHVSTPILLLTARDAISDKICGYDSGADDYMTKPFSPAELLAHLRALTRRQGDVVFETLTVGDLSLKADEVTNNQQLTVTGNVKGSFDSVARGSSGRTEHFQFDWTAKQVKEGRDAFATSDDAIQQTLLVDKPEQREPPGDVKDDAPKVPAVPAAAPKAPAATPNTGDSTNYAPLSMLGALGLVAVVAAAVVRRRWRDER